MKLIKYSLLALATAFAFSSCNDDNKYVEGAQSPGAFFPKDAPSVVELPETGNSVDITIARTSLDDPSTYTLHGEDESGIFTFPTSVTFGPREHTTTITVTYDGDMIITDELYPATLTVEGASTYGDGTYSFDFCRKSPLIVTETSGLFYTDMWTGSPIDVDIDWCVSEGDPDLVTVKMYMFRDNITVIDIDLSKEAQYPDGTHPAVLHTTPTSVTNNDGFEIYWSSVMDFFLGLNYTEEEVWEEYPETKYGCNFNSQTGVISLFTTYTLPEKGAGYWYNVFNESIHLDGYPDYSVEVSYTGLFIDPKGHIFANAVVSSGADVSEVRVANVATDNYADALEGLKNGTYEYETVKGGQEGVTVQFPVTDPGLYTLVAVSVDGNGNLQLDAYETYQMTIGYEDPNKGWTSLGMGEFTDGVATVIWQGVTPAQVTYAAEIQQKDDAPGVYRVVDVFGNNPLNQYNEYDEPGYFMVDCTNPNFPMATLQFVGWEDDWGKLSYGNYEARLQENNPDATPAQIQTFMLNNDIELSTFSKGVITLPNPLFTFSIKYPSPMVAKDAIVITLPSAVKGSPSKVAGSTTYSGNKKTVNATKAIRAHFDSLFTR